MHLENLFYHLGAAYVPAVYCSLPKLMAVMSNGHISLESFVDTIIIVHMEDM